MGAGSFASWCFARSLAVMDYIGIDDKKKIGGGLTAFGLFFMFMGVMLLFDRSLLAMGNILFLSGVVLLIGPANAMSFFFVRTRLQGTICFFLGIAMVLYGWTITGMLAEGFGFINLFGNFFPTALMFATKLPYVGKVFETIRNILPASVGSNSDGDDAERFPV